MYGMYFVQKFTISVIVTAIFFFLETASKQTMSPNPFQVSLKNVAYLQH